MNTRSHDRRSRRGFALLMVVACLLLVTTASVAVSRRSLLVAMESAAAADRLQEQWGRLSLERAALRAAVALYGEEPPAFGPPVAEREPDERKREQSAFRPFPSVHRLPAALGERHYTLVLADESAKANLNTALRLKPPEAVRTLAAALGGGGRTMGRLVLPQPTRARRRPGEDAVIRTWGQVLPIGAAERGDLPIEQLPAATERLTVFGDGKLNVLHAADDVLFGLSRFIVSDGKSRDWIRAFREAFPEKSPEQVFRELGFTVQERVALTQLIAVRSTTLSVWVLDEGPSSAHSFTLAERAGAGAWRTRTFRYTR